MADAGPDYAVERKRLSLQKLEHEGTIDAGNARLSAIERQKKVNIARAELANDELDSEAKLIKANETSLNKAIEDIDQKISKMTKEAGNG
jgi:predicted  nucleic acid-binding Zn-ribbon protein